MTLSLLFAFCSANVTQADFSPLAKSNVFTDEFQWKAVEACPRIRVRVGEAGSGSSVILAIKEREAWALTAAHVVRDSSIIDADLFLKANYPGTAAILSGVKVVARNAAADLALIKIPLGEYAAVPPTLKLAQPGTRPKKFPFPALSVGCDEGFSTRCFNVSIQGKRFVRRPDSQMAYFWEARDPSGHGRSGGPLLDKSGNVIGICAANMDGMGYFAYSDEIHAWLKSTGFEWIWKEEPRK